MHDSRSATPGSFVMLIAQLALPPWASQAYALTSFGRFRPRANNLNASTTENQRVDRPRPHLQRLANYKPSLANRLGHPARQASWPSHSELDRPPKPLAMSVLGGGLRRG